MYFSIEACLIVSLYETKHYSKCEVTCDNISACLNIVCMSYWIIIHNTCLSGRVGRAAAFWSKINVGLHILTIGCSAGSNPPCSPTGITHIQ